MSFYFKRIVFFLLIIALTGSVAWGACAGNVAIWGTNDDKASCIKKKLLEKKKRELAIEKIEKEINSERRALSNNNGTGSGTGNTNVILGGLQDLVSPKDTSEPVGKIEFSRHQFRLEWIPYVVAGAYQFDEPGTPENLLSIGVAWEYFLNPNLAIGVVMAQFDKTGGRNFDPVMAIQRDGSGDTAVFFPGAIDRIKYTSYTLYASINAPIDHSWMSILRLGIGRTQVDVEYADINPAANPYAKQPGDNTYIDNASLMAGLAIEHLSQSGTRVGFEIRYQNAHNETADYTEYMNLGSAQAIIYVQFMLRPLGLL